MLPFGGHNLFHKKEQLLRSVPSIDWSGRTSLHLGESIEYLSPAASMFIFLLLCAGKTSDGQKIEDQAYKATQITRTEYPFAIAIHKISPLPQGVCTGRGHFGAMDTDRWALRARRSLRMDLARESTTNTHVSRILR